MYVNGVRDGDTSVWRVGYVTASSDLRSSDVTGTWTMDPNSVYSKIFSDTPRPKASFVRPLSSPAVCQCQVRLEALCSISRAWSEALLGRCEARDFLLLLLAVPCHLLPLLASSQTWAAAPPCRALNARCSS